MVNFKDFCNAFRTQNEFIKLIKVNKSKYNFSLVKARKYFYDYINSVDCRTMLEDYIDIRNGDNTFFISKFAKHKDILFGLT